MLESLGDSRLQKLVFRHIPVSSEFFVIEPEREPFRLIPPLYPEGVEKHGPPGFQSASEATSSVGCLKRSQTTCKDGAVWLRSSSALSSNIVRHSPECVEVEFCE